jgi:hypothetical protein
MSDGYADSNDEEIEAGPAELGPAEVLKRQRRLRMVNEQLPPCFSKLKKEIEKTYAYLDCEEYGGYIRLLKNGGFSLIDNATLANNLAATYTRVEAGPSNPFKVALFWPEWHRHPDKKTFHSIVYDPCNKDPDAVNALPVPNALQLLRTKGGLTPEEVQTRSQWFWDLLSDRIPDADQREFLLGLFANMVQNPMEPSQVLTILAGEPGSGKNTIVDFIRQKVLGPQLGESTADMKTFVFGTHGAMTKLKSMVVLEELAIADSRQFIEQMKDKVTARTVCINEKYKPQMSYPNICNFFATTNNAYPIPVAVNDRRVAVIEMLNDPPADGREYWKRVTANARCDEPIRLRPDGQPNPNLPGRDDPANIIAVYLQAMDISHYLGSFQSCRPQGKMYREMQSTSIDLHFKFFSAMVTEHEDPSVVGERKFGFNALYLGFQDWAKGNGYNSIVNKRVFDKAMRVLAEQTACGTPPAVVITRGSAGMIVSICCDQLKQHLVRKRVFDELSAGFEFSQLGTVPKAATRQHATGYDTTTQRDTETYPVDFLQDTSPASYPKNLETYQAWSTSKRARVI